jgi:hypothetical protein
VDTTFKHHIRFTITLLTVLLAGVPNASSDMIVYCNKYLGLYIGAFNVLHSRVRIIIICTVSSLLKVSSLEICLLITPRKYKKIGRNTTFC